MAVLNDLDRFHFVMDTIDHLPQTGGKESRAISSSLHGNQATGRG
jgi:phosphoketolase